MKTVLFLCTGNYYRSRYAELLFNWKAQETDLQWRSCSRGLAPDPRNPGPISIHTLDALKQQKIPVEGNLRLPLKVTDGDFQSSQHVIAVKEAEHRPLIEREFPEWLTMVEFWHIHGGSHSCVIPSTAGSGTFGESVKARPIQKSDRETVQSRQTAFAVWLTHPQKHMQYLTPAAGNHRGRQHDQKAHGHQPAFSQIVVGCKSFP